MVLKKLTSILITRLMCFVITITIFVIINDYIAKVYIQLDSVIGLTHSFSTCIDCIYIVHAYARPGFRSTTVLFDPLGVAKTAAAYFPWIILYRIIYLKNNSNITWKKNKMDKTFTFPFSVAPFLSRKAYNRILFE